MAHHVGIVCQKTTEPRGPHSARTQFLEAVYGSEVQNGNHTAEIAWCVSVLVELVHEFLDPFDYAGSESRLTQSKQFRLTHVNDADIHAEGLTGEVGNITHIVAHVPYSRQPVENGGPDGGPADEPGIDADIVDADYIVNGVVEE